MPLFNSSPLIPGRLNALLLFAALTALSTTLASSAPLPLPTPLVNRSVLELDLALDPLGRPLLAWVEEVSANTHPLYVQRLESGVWRRLGGGLTRDPKAAAQGVFVRPTPQNTVWAAWSENGGHADIVQFARWDGSVWQWQQNMRQSIDLTYAARSRNLQLEPDGTPLWAWAEISQTGIGVATRRWNGVEWEKSEPLSLDVHKIATQPALATNSKGDRAMVWLEGDGARSEVRVKYWNTKTWENLGEALNVVPNTFTFAPTVQLDPQGNPLVAWLEDRAGVDTLFVSRWNGSSWTRLGDALNVNPAQFADRPSLTVKADGTPCVAWAEGGETLKGVYLKCFLENRWQGVGNRIQHSGYGADARSPKLASSGQELFIAWRERKAGPYRLEFRTF